MNQKEAQNNIPQFFNLFIFLLENVITLKGLKQLPVYKIITLILLFYFLCVVSCEQSK